jgi:hypothetical protein
VQHDWTFSFKTQLYQIKKSYGSTVRAKSEVIVRRHLDGSVSAWYKDTQLKIIELNEKPPKVIAKKNQLTRNEIAILSKEKSPWNRTNHEIFNTDNNPTRYKDFRFKNACPFRVK